MSAPRLLFVVTEDWYFVSHRLPLARAAREAGFDVWVAARATGREREIMAEGVQFVPLNLSRRGGNPPLELFRLIRLYRRVHPDILHLVALKPVLFGGIAAALAGLPRVVGAVAGLGWLFLSQRRLVRLVRPWIKRSLALVFSARGRRAIVQNPDDQDLLQRSGVPEAHIEVIRGAGVDVHNLRPSTEPKGPVTVVLVARMLRDKGVGEFVAAAHSLIAEGVEARFVLVGDVDPANPASFSREQLQSWDGQGGVEWWGHRADIAAVLAQSHIACLPSYREGLPKSLLEAAAAGLPIVTTDTAGCREVVESGENGFLVPVRAVEPLADALRTLIQDADLRARMGQRSRELAEREFTHERVQGQTLALYRALLAEVA